MNRLPRIILTSFVFLLAVVAAQAQAKPLVAKWVREDIKGVSAIVKLLPFDQQDIEALKASLKKDWHVVETELGFDARYLELEKGRGYSMGYVHALLYEGRVVRYEAGIESYASEWAGIRGVIIEKWKENEGPEPSVEEHGIAFRQTIPSVLREYQARVAGDLGRLSDTSVPPDLMESYSSLTDSLTNSTISGTRQNEDIVAILNSNRIDLLENVLKAYNPGARVLAAIAFLKLQQSGTQLRSAILQTVAKVLNLPIKLHACVFDMCNDLTAKEAFRWFDSGLAFPLPKVERRP